ncbi:MAG: hypothetical protein JSS27_20820 [Planctomycetes bacterium]|nr:hypothetical protein [Planctomycetota bacterium]
MFTRGQQRATGLVLCITMAALLGLGPAVRHAHGIESGVAHQHQACCEIKLLPASTHWHVDWFGFELTLADEGQRSAPEEAEILQASDLIATRHQPAAVESSKLATVMAPDLSSFAADSSVATDDAFICRKFEAASSLVLTQHVVALRN